MPRTKRQQFDSIDPSNAPSTSNQNRNCQSSSQAAYRSTMLRTSSVNASSYIDNGDCNNICEFCGACFWYDERVVSASNNQRPKYMQCCKGGRVAIPFHTQLPAAIVGR
ncbi:unnamed protein product [Lactuca virosa]|uniref:Uncharacterized protein n=1 Tax=Lactuca virosa TaxID=75947 RepID=A0AAU9P6A1_9ASTR|nr:unnamed protein product [Lactuca virosa]